jgi:hypothetical protein
MRGCLLRTSGVRPRAVRVDTRSLFLSAAG